MAYHDSNSYRTDINDFSTMSIKELNTVIDAEMIELALEDIMALDPAKRSAAIADFAEIDSLLGQRLSLAVSFRLS